MRTVTVVALAGIALASIYSAYSKPGNFIRIPTSDDLKCVDNKLNMQITYDQFSNIVVKCTNERLSIQDGGYFYAGTRAPNQEPPAK
jgi:hypothetical protein